MFTPSQFKHTIRPNSFTSQDAGIYSNAKLDQFGDIILVSKHSDYMLQLLGKAVNHSVIPSNTPEYDANSPHDNPFSALRIGLHDEFSNLTHPFTPTWFYDAFISLFGHIYSVLTQWGKYFSNLFYTSN